MDYTRRDFLNTITSATIAAAGLSAVPVFKGIKSESREQYDAIPDRGTVLFQGDSITDAGRNREELTANSGLGYGYALFAAAQLRNELASRQIEVYNRGVSGNKVFQLADRWQDDCLQLQPDLLSILIGVNDFWHTLDGGYDGTIEVYRKDFRSLLDRTKSHLPNVRLVIGEPFIVEEGSAIKNDEWLPNFDEYRQAAREIAREFNATFIPYQAIFDEASERANPTYWTEDGVHPTMAGSELMAQGWIETVKRM